MLNNISFLVLFVSCMIWLWLQPHHILSEFSWLVGVFNVNFLNVLPYVGRHVFFWGLLLCFWVENCNFDL